MKTRISIAYTCLVLLFSSGPLAAQTLKISDFSSPNLDGWEKKQFKGSTSYQLTTIERRRVLSAQSRDSASALIKKVHIDIKKHPFLNWTWRIENRLVTRNKKLKSGDDYAVRIYVVIDGGIFIWRTRAVNYVWANQASKGETWKNAFAGKNAQMVALRNNQDKLSTWYIEKRNVYEDLKQLFGTGYRFIDAIAIMTDTDNSHGQATAYYGDIYFSSD
jgi:hypothetical protein